MPKFYTVFDVAPIKNKDKVYDRHDNVDRTSYVDSTRLIERFIYEGNNLNAVRARALNSGMYSDYKDALSSEDGFVAPVYETDPAIMQPIIERAADELKSRAAKKNDVIKHDDNNGSSDLTEPSKDFGKNSPDSTVQ